ncbi:HPr family phosphocarrier protein [Shewanella sp. NIFS-20-20]|uniref:HPr family phosphocarrier protein n=1 Tax=Shewanella sp. NIFS-20-20 TaxID=2853806 RepID=UPI001C48D3D8|nr:HPr family phosphocarrier protein [Shewanella sp. NIFS-20-20]MBV7317037.1 HPr family phosphocarrier protein [Shewanella sp. NIFS-20-20]
MYRQTTIIHLAHGLHTRPAAQFVKAAKHFDCDIIVYSQGKQASAKSLFKLQTLGLSQGCEITIEAQGADAQTAVSHLINLLDSLE